MLVPVKRTVYLPKHPETTGSHPCPNCGYMIIPYEGDNIYGDVRVCNIHGWTCLECDFDEIPSHVAKLIEETLEGVKE